ncbi:MAG: adenylyl-sulfate kinase [Candidatus Methylarchaceae archaeon HK01M]|nr:adenylyl-sulfate kinase [Candidatus Methylarchaceae archaeon HK01M]
MIEGWCVWLTGLPGSGKSTVAKALHQKLKKNEIHAQILSSDGLRKAITPDPKYTDEERDIVYKAISYIAKLLTKNSVNVIIDATGNRRRYRDKAREEMKNFMEVYLICPLSVCMERESKRIDTSQAPRGIYEKALKGKSKVPGFGAPYEEPLNPELKLNTERLNPDACVKRIFDLIVKKKT